MDKEKARDVLVWYGYPNAQFDSQDGESIFYFRTVENRKGYVLKVVEIEDSIEIYQADEDYYEKYEIDFYYFDIDATFTKKQIDEYLSKNRI